MNRLMLIGLAAVGYVGLAMLIVESGDVGVWAAVGMLLCIETICYCAFGMGKLAEREQSEEKDPWTARAAAYGEKFKIHRKRIDEELINSGTFADLIFDVTIADELGAHYKNLGKVVQTNESQGIYWIQVSEPYIDKFDEIYALAKKRGISIHQAKDLYVKTQALR